MRSVFEESEFPLDQVLSKVVLEVLLLSPHNFLRLLSEAWFLDWEHVLKISKNILSTFRTLLPSFSSLPTSSDRCIPPTFSVFIPIHVIFLTPFFSITNACFSIVTGNYVGITFSVVSSVVFVICTFVDVRFHLLCCSLMCRSITLRIKISTVTNLSTRLVSTTFFAFKSTF